MIQQPIALLPIKRTVLVGVMSSFFALGGCQDTYSTGGRSLDGGLIGGGAGAAIGALAGGGRGAAIGAVSGGLLGAATGAITTPNRPAAGQAGYQYGYPQQQYNNGAYQGYQQPVDRCQPGTNCHSNYPQRGSYSGY